ncbi:MAG: general secretion pathway protein M [Flavobacteriales bacterium]|jgi:general secretion pathway protein M
MNALKDWWAQAPSRDQLALSALAGALLIYLLFTAVLNPVAGMAEEARAQNQARQAAYERVKDLAAQWINRDTDGSGGAKSSVDRIVENSISQHQLRVSGLDASGRSGIRVRFDEGVSYEKFLRWMAELELTQGVRFKDVSVSRGSEEGLVSASVLIQK